MLESEWLGSRLRRAGWGHVQVLGPCGGGTRQAFDVVVNAERRILKWQVTGHGTALTQVSRDLKQLRRRGYPVPSYEVIESAVDIEMSLQSLMPGTVVDKLSDRLVGQLLRVNALQRGAGSIGPRSWGDRVVDITLNGAPGWCRHESLELHSDRTRRFWERARAAVSQNLDRFPDGDLVHMDFHHRNVLQQDGQLVAVIDWEGLETGDCNFDLVTLFFYAGAAGWSRESRLGALDQLRPALPAECLRTYVAHLGVRAIDWAIRIEGPSDVQRWLVWSEEALDSVA